MTSTIHDDTTSNKWFTVYVPAPSTVNNATVGGTQGYLRIGSPDTSTETSFLNTLKTAYTSLAADAAVQAAFGSASTAGVVLYTAGDMVQFVNGTSDTRVLNDRYVVHVLNKTDDESSRAYFRLGKPYDTVENDFDAEVDDASLAAMVKALAPIPTATLITDGSTKASAALNTDDATNRATARTNLYDPAHRGDGHAVDAIDTLLKKTVTCTRGTTDDDKTANKTETQVWARNTLQALHMEFANTRKTEAIANSGSGRTKLQSAAATDPLAWRKLQEISGLSGTDDASLNARNWANGVLKNLPVATRPRWTLGNGVALYSDKPITITTPDKLAVTTSSDARTVFGESYSEVYDVDDDVVAKIKNGTYASIDQVGSKKLITATLVRPSAGTWRTSTFDQSKTLGFKFSDYGSWELSSSYSFGAGLKFANALTVGFSATLGVSVTVDSVFGVAVQANNMQTSYPGESVSFWEENCINGDKIMIAADGDTSKLGVVAQRKFSDACRVTLSVINGLNLAWTAIGIGVGNQKVDAGKTSADNVKTFLQASEYIYGAATILNAILTAVGIVCGCLQLVISKATKVAQTPRILINDEGILIMGGPTSCIAVTKDGILINGAKIKHSGPMTQFDPAPQPVLIEPTYLKAVTPSAKDIASFIAG